MQENNMPPRPYKIMLGDSIIVYRTEYNNNVYYKTMITKKKQDNTKERFYKEIRFRKGVNLPNKSMIKIKNMFEDVRNNPKDAYNPIFSLVILDFDIVENPFDKSEAITSYNNNALSEEIDDSYFADVANEEDIETPW